jgi:uncharacterized surface protein with fasciclin (FAS1) repeats
MNSGLIFGLVAVVAIIGAVILFQGNDKADMTDTVVVTEDASADMDADMVDGMDEEGDMMEGGFTLVDAAVDTPQLSTLVTALTAAELAETLSGEGPFTVFAPTNDAFAALPAGTLDTLLMTENQTDLRDVLTYHVIEGEVMSADLSDGQVVTTFNGETVTIGVGDGVTLNNDVSVVEADIMTDNGVVHIIDGVLLP